MNGEFRLFYVKIVNTGGDGTMNILFLRAGIFSNLNHYLYEALCRSHNVVTNVDAGKVIKRKSLQFSSWYNIFHTIIYAKKYWKQAHSKNIFAFSRMTQYCNRIVRSRTDYDIILQTQCKFSITENPYSQSYYIYTDLTQKLTDRTWHKWALKGSPEETARWLRMEAEAFQRAEKIFTFNDLIKASFVEDYHINPNKVVVVGSGINSDQCPEIDFNTKYDDGFILFFLTTEFDRQGGPTIVKSFEIIKQTIPDIKLVIGGQYPKSIPGSVTVCPHLTPEIIDDLFDKTSIFLMPGVIGGLQSVMQAMSRKCVCIVGDNNLLLAHVIKNNETGFVIPTNCSKKLADKIIELYKNESVMKKIANRACQFVYENFTWDKVVQQMTHNF